MHYEDILEAKALAVESSPTRPGQTTVLKFDHSNLPEDPRENGYVRAHDPDGRAADIQEVNEAFHLKDPETGTEYDMPEGGFLVWQDGEWSAEK